MPGSAGRSGSPGDTEAGRSVDGGRPDAKLIVGMEAGCRYSEVCNPARMKIIVNDAGNL
jgi:hypothetical protein